MSTGPVTGAPPRMSDYCVEPVQFEYRSTVDPIDYFYSEFASLMKIQLAPAVQPAPTMYVG